MNNLSLDRTKVLTCVCALLMSSAVGAENITATVVAGHTDQAKWVRHLSNSFIPTANQWLQGTGHQIEWTQKYGGTLAPPGGALEAIEDGQAELGIVSTWHEPDKLAAQSITFYTPFVSTDPDTISDLIDALHRNNSNLRMAWEENGLEYLGGGFTLDDHLLLTNFPVNTIDDLNGRKIAGTGPTLAWLSGSTAAGLSADVSTYYEELEGGIYDGVIAPATIALSNQLHEQAPFVTRVGFGAQYIGGIAANKNWYDRLPVEVQAALKQAAKAQRIAYHRDLQMAVVDALSIMADKGATITKSDDAFRQQWAERMDNIAAEWATSMNERGMPGSTILQLYMNTMIDAGAMPLRSWDRE